MVLPGFIRDYLQARQRVDLPSTLTRRRIYILPTTAGFVFGIFLLAMLLAAINYTNNLAFLLTFLLGSIAVLSAIHAYSNLAGLVVEHGRVAPVYCGDDARLRLGLHGAGRFRRALVVTRGQAATSVSLTADTGQEVELSMPTSRRGRLIVGQIRISTRFPLGLFRSWSPLVLPLVGLVYPRVIAADPRDWVALTGNGDDGGRGAVAMTGDFAGLRPYRPEDGLSRVSWKASARGGGLQAKEYRQGVAHALLLDWERLRGGGYEERISRLAGLVREAEAMGAHYGLLLPGRRIDIGSGAAHVRQCLEALALMPDES